MHAPPSDPTNLNRVIGWFIALRWAACAGVIAAVSSVAVFFRYPMPYVAIGVVTAVLIAVNVLFTLYFAVLRRRSLAARETGPFLTLQVWCDYALLFVLVHLGGLVENPFSYYFVFHVMLTAYLFATPRVFVYVGALIAAFGGAFGLGYLGLIPTFSLARGMLSGAEARAWWQARIPGAIGLGSTLLIAAYLMLAIKRRFEEKGRWVEVELDRYKSLDRIKSNFILQVTHELRGPLAAVNGYHEMMVRGITGEIPQKTRETVLKATRRVDGLLHMIDEMIDYAYMNSDTETRYARSRLDVGEVIGHVVEATSTQAAAKGIRIVTNAPRGLGIEANRDLLTIILGNLVTNAVKYSPAGTTVTVSAADEGEEAHLTVTDQGMGIEAEELERLFEEFYRTRRAREREKDGTGLGLVITKRAVENLHGRIQIYSEVDRGTAFHVYLPKGGLHG